MKRFLGLFMIVFVVAATLFSSTATYAQTTPNAKGPAAAPQQGKLIPDHYIVTLKAGAKVRAVAALAQANPRFVYEAALNGFAAELNARQLEIVRRHPDVVAVEQDQEVTIDATQSNATWGLDRIDQRNLPLSGSYSYNTSGTGVRAYVIDTGIQTNHPDFGGRASAVYDALGGNGQDCNGHGTHVAGTIGSATYGVAKNAYLRAVRVLNCQGSGTNSQVLAGINWVAQNAIKPAVANMSLGGGYSQAENDAVTNLANSGVFIAVAAGNESQDACNVSPASASGALTVAASNSSDTRASFSNYGGCVDVYAPGVSITSTWLNSGTNTISGTSMASPHAAGVAALYKSAYGDAASSTIASWIVDNATSNVIGSNPSGTPNRLLYKGGL